MLSSAVRGGVPALAFLLNVHRFSCRGAVSLALGDERYDLVLILLEHGFSLSSFHDVCAAFKSHRAEVASLVFAKWKELDKEKYSHAGLNDIYHAIFTSTHFDPVFAVKALTFLNRQTGMKPSSLYLDVNTPPASVLFQFQNWIKYGQTSLADVCLQAVKVGNAAAAAVIYDYLEKHNNLALRSTVGGLLDPVRILRLALDQRDQKTLLFLISIKSISLIPATTIRYVLLHCSPTLFDENMNFLHVLLDVEDQPSPKTLSQLYEVPLLNIVQAQKSDQDSFSQVKWDRFVQQAFNWLLRRNIIPDFELILRFIQDHPEVGYHVETFMKQSPPFLRTEYKYAQFVLTERKPCSISLPGSSPFINNWSHNLVPNLNSGPPLKQRFLGRPSPFRRPYGTSAPWSSSTPTSPCPLPSTDDGKPNYSAVSIDSSARPSASLFDSPAHMMFWDRSVVSEASSYFSSEWGRESSTTFSFSSSFSSSTNSTSGDFSPRWESSTKQHNSSTDAMDLA